MITIIKHGNKIKQAKCRNCGCTFIFNECFDLDKYDRLKCPECDEFIHDTDITDIN